MANFRSPGANSASTEANSGSLGANSGFPEANSGSQGANFTLSRGQLKLHSCKFDIFIVVDELLQHTFRCRAFKSLGLSKIKQLSNKFFATLELHVFSFGKQSFKRLHRKLLTSHSSVINIRYRAYEPLSHFPQSVSYLKSCFPYFCLMHSVLEIKS